MKLKGVFAAVGLLALTFLSGCTSSTANAAPLSPNYIAAQKALTIDDYPNAKKALKELAVESSGEFGKAAEEAASAPDIESMRVAFRSASDVLIKNGVPSEYAVAYCPMFKGGSSWVQMKGSIENPYTGKSMPGCGEFKKK